MNRYPLLSCLVLAVVLSATACTSRGGEETTSTSETPPQTTDAQPPATPELATTEPTAPPFTAPATATPRIPGHGQAQSGHLKLTGTSNFDVDIQVFCATLPGGIDQMTLFGQGSPRVLVRFSDLKESGAYDAQVRVLLVDTGETMRESRGPAKADVTVTPTAAPRPGRYLSGKFSGTFQGAGGKGTVEGSFERCFKEDPPAATGTEPSF
jgi:hypothetical protein